MMIFEEPYLPQQLLSVVNTLELAYVIFVV